MFTLDQIVPWGRSFAEYERMFALTADDLQGRILGCADGPAGFNAEATRRGFRVISCDPLYRFSAADILARMVEARGEVLDQARRNYDLFVWKEIASVEELGRVRWQAMQTFLADYETGKRAERYIDAALPNLPFSDHAFELALSSHLLFLYTDHLSLEFHCQAMMEMCRVAREVRLFPLLTLAGNRSSLVEPVRHAAELAGYTAVIEKVPYEFHRGGNEMLRITHGEKAGSGMKDQG